MVDELLTPSSPEGQGRSSSPTDFVIRNLDTGGAVPIHSELQSPRHARCEGYLDKKSQDKLGGWFRGSFQRRWFTLEGNELCYYSEDATVLKKRYSWFRMCTEQESLADNVFQVLVKQAEDGDAAPERALTLRASSSGEVAKWQRQLELSLQSQKEAKAFPGQVAHLTRVVTAKLQMTLQGNQVERYARAGSTEHKDFRVEFQKTIEGVLTAAGAGADLDCGLLVTSMLQDLPGAIICRFQLSCGAHIDVGAVLHEAIASDLVIGGARACNDSLMETVGSSSSAWI